MTDEELAEQYAQNLEKELMKEYEEYPEYGQTPYLATIPTPHAKQAFLAGLKAGRPQWHTPDVPTSPINKIVLGYIKDYNTKKLCLVKWNGEWWYDARTWNDKVKLIAWCEIHTFDKE